MGVKLPEDAITSFKGEFSFLSNFYNYRGRTVEHLYQASKATNVEDRVKILKAANPAEAKRLGRQVKMLEGFEAIKISNMYGLLQEKFESAEMIRLLKSTGNRMLVEGNDWGDTFWGMVKQRDGTWVGCNVLGNLLMCMRRDVRAK
jgi:ribA/ribD-fused uncharacterized protein